MISLCDRLRTYAGEMPGRAALLEPAVGMLSFAGLWEELERLGEVLRGAGIGRSDVVAVILPDGLCGLVALLGAARVCACAPMNPALTAPEMESALRQLEVRAIIVTDELGMAARIARELGCLVIEAGYRKGSCGWTVSGIASGPPPEFGEAVLLLPTSGTTGRRKVVPLSEGNLEAMLHNTAATLGLTRDDRLLMLARLFHVQGILSPLAQLQAGGSVIMAPGFDEGQFNGWMEELRPTWFTCGPTLHGAIVAHLGERPFQRPHSLRFVRSGGAPLPGELRVKVEDALGVPLLNVYGLSETGAVASTRAGDFDLDAEGAATCVGRSMGPEIAVMDAEGGLLAANEEGEVVVGGPTVMCGYWRDPAANAESFFGRWFRTGDLGRLDAGGSLHITGRLKEMINRGGQKISPSEVDEVLAAHEAVREVAAFALPHRTLGEDVGCAVVLRPGFAAGERELREFAARQLAAYKVPRRVFRVESIPRGATGKPQRLVLRERFSAPGSERDSANALTAERGAAGGVEKRAGPTDLRESIAWLWSRYLKSADGDENFFSRGGDSLAATAMLTEAERLFDLKSKLSRGEFFQDPTQATLAGMIGRAIRGADGVKKIGLAKTGAAKDAGRVGQGGDDWSIRVVGVRQASGKPPLFLVPSDGEEGWCFRRLSMVMGMEWPLSLVRPGGCWHERSATSIADAGRESAEAIRAAISTSMEPGSGPVVVGGFCYGGVVAYETACAMERAGGEVLLVLFDVPVPGRPHLLREWRVIAGAMVDGFRDAWRARRLRPAAAILRKVARRSAWFAIRRVAPGGVGRIDSRLVRWWCEQAQRNYFSFHRLKTTRIPVLHFIADFEHDRLMTASRLAWAELGLSGVTIKRLPGGHNDLFGEENLQVMARTIDAWVKGRPGMPRENTGDVVALGAAKRLRPQS